MENDERKEKMEVKTHTTFLFLHGVQSETKAETWLPTG